MTMFGQQLPVPKAETDVHARFVDMVAATVFPTLTDEQVNRLLRESRRVDIYGWLPSWDLEWAPATVYEQGIILVPTIRNGHVYQVTDPGTSGATEPVWPLVTQGSVTLDGVEYTEVTDFLTVWYGAWDLNRAAAEGWRIKAGLVSNRHDFGSNQGNYNPSQVFEHCNQMAAMYAAKTVGAIVQASGRWDGSGRIPGAHWDDAK